MLSAKSSEQSDSWPVQKKQQMQIAGGKKNIFAEDGVNWSAT